MEQQTSNESFILDYSDSKWSSRTKIIFSRSQNNFTFLRSPQSKKEQQSHASKSQGDIIQSFGMRIGKRLTIKTDFWLQRSDREIPPTLVQNTSNATQSDKAIRTLMELQYRGSKSIGSLKTAYMIEDQYYEDDLLYRNKFNSLFLEAEYQTQLSKDLLSIGVSMVDNKAQTASYKSQVSENRYAFFTNYLLKRRVIQTKISIRQSIIDNRLSPILPAIVNTFKMNDKHSLSLVGSRNFRVPTLNNRYWVPGGDKELKDEIGWSEEVTYRFQSKNFNMEASGFNRVIKNWILWTFKPGENFVSAQNIAKVWS